MRPPVLIAGTDVNHARPLEIAQRQERVASVEVAVPAGRRHVHDLDAHAACGAYFKRQRKSHGSAAQGAAGTECSPIKSLLLAIDEQVLIEAALVEVVAARSPDAVRIYLGKANYTIFARWLGTYDICLCAHQSREATA